MARGSVLRRSGGVARWAATVLLVSSTSALAEPPDISGMWAPPFRVHSSGYPLMAGMTQWMAASRGDPATQHVPSLDELSVIADRSVAEHHGNPTFGSPQPPPPPLNDAGRAVLAKTDLKALEERGVACYPANIVSRNGGIGQIVQGKRAVALVSDGGLGRTIYLDGRSEQNALPQWNGHSVGHWDGDVLKVVTTGIRGETFGFQGWPMTDKATFSEEFRLAAGGRRLIVTDTFFDPTYYTEPLRRMQLLDRRPATDEVLDYTCTEGKADMVEMQPTTK